MTTLPPDDGPIAEPGLPADICVSANSSPPSELLDPAPAIPVVDSEVVTAAESPSPDESSVESHDDEWEEESEVDTEATGADMPADRVVRPKRRKRRVRTDAVELRLLGRRAMCKQIADIAPRMGKQIKLRILTAYLDAKRLAIGREDEDLTKFILSEAAKLADRKRVLETVRTPSPDFRRDDLKAIILAVLLQEETFSLPERRLDEKVIETEKSLVKRSRSLDLNELRKTDPDRWHHLDTYRIVLDAAWTHDGMVSPDEARLLGVLRSHLGLTLEEHWLIGALLKRFPTDKCGLHTPDEINEARKELQRQGLVWNYKDDDDQSVDVIPAEVATVLRKDYAGLELQSVNFRRLVSHDAILVPELRSVLHRHGADRSGNKAELIERLVACGATPSEVLGELDKEKLSAVAAGFGLRSSGAKAELVERLIDFYDDLTFEERVTRDKREEWYANYELLAGRAYAELRAKKVINRDLEVEHFFEDAIAFLFEARLRVPCDMTRKENKADGRLQLPSGQTLLLDCKSAETAVNLQDYLDSQFDGYLRREATLGRQPIGFLVIAPVFTPISIRLAHQYKARTNWDIALVTAEGLRHLADRWAAAGGDKPFPVQLLNKTELIDKDRAEFLLSLA